MKFLVYLLILSSILSITAFFIRYLKTKNVMLIGKIFSRIFLLWASLLSVIEYLRLIDIFIAIIVINISDFIYDLFNYIIFSRKKNIIKNLLTYNRFLDSNLPVFVADKQTGIIEFVNETFLSVVKLNKGDIIGKNISDVFTGLDINDLCDSNILQYDDYKIKCFELENGKTYIASYLY